MWLRETRAATADGSRYLFRVAVCGGKEADADMRQTQGGEQSHGEQIQPEELQTEGKEVQTRCASEEGDRQCHSRNRTKYIYINSLLYNHDKQQQKNSHKNINLK